MSKSKQNLTVVNTCPTCKHCMVSSVLNDDGNAWSEIYTKVYHCMWKVSKSDRQYAEDEIDSYDGDPYDVSFTDKFNDIMKLESKDRDRQCLEDSSRLVHSNTYCQFYEKEE